MKRILSFVLITIIAGAVGCTYDKAELIHPVTLCDTTNIKYTGGIESIIHANCDVCHAGTAFGSGGINLDSYADLKIWAAPNGPLLLRITSTDPSIMMPKGGPRLSDCDINKFRAWINNGTPQ